MLLHLHYETFLLIDTQFCCHFFCENLKSEQRHNFIQKLSQFRLPRRISRAVQCRVGSDIHSLYIFNHFQISAVPCRVVSLAVYKGLKPRLISPSRHYQNVYFLCIYFVLSAFDQVPERSINSSSRRSKQLLHVFRLTLSNAKEPVQQDWFPYHKQCYNMLTCYKLF